MLTICSKIKLVLACFLILILLIGCSKKQDCDNKFDFISAKDTIPVLNFDSKDHYSITRETMSGLYYDDLCKRCSWIEFKIPFTIEGKDGFLKILADFDTPYCPNCPIPQRIRDYYPINITKKRELYAEDQVVSIDSLQFAIEKYLQNVGKTKSRPRLFNQVNYLVRWSKGTNQTFLDSVLAKIYKAHLKVVESKVRESNEDFCLLEKKEILKLKKDYPLRIEFDLGKFEKIAEEIHRDFNMGRKNGNLIEKEN